MKIRNLVLKAKLKKFQKGNENQNFFLFHYTANASEWRSLKNLLHHEKLKQNQNLYSEQKKLMADEDFHTNSLKSLKLSRSKEQLHSLNIYGTEKDKSNQILSYGISTLFYSERPKKTDNAKGSFFLFEMPFLGQYDVPSLFRWELFELKNANFKLVRKIESLDENQTPIFLYGRVHSMVMNHVDIKQASSLDLQTTYQQLFFSMQWLIILLNLSLRDNVNQFLNLQEARKRVEIQNKK